MYNDDDLLFKFTEHLKVLNRSPATIEAYVANARHFLKAMDIPDVRQITTPVLESYIAGLYDHRTKDDKPYSLAAISIKIRAIKRFFEYLESVNIIFINPAEPVKEPPKNRGRVKPALTPAEARAMLDQPNLATPLGVRDRAVLEVLYCSGIRLEELCRLSVFDVDLKGRMIRINQGKGRKDRVVPLGRHAAKALREYITHVRPNMVKKNRGNRSLFVLNRGQALTRVMAQILVKQYARAAGIKKPVSPHTFRHTFATTLVQNGADIVAVQKMLGHASLKTTQEYIRTLGLDIKKAHAKTHPRERDKEPAGSHKPHIERMRP
jgi:integrase/recombinase XerD